LESSLPEIIQEKKKMNILKDGNIIKNPEDPGESA